jgi:hypothetical protein
MSRLAGWIRPANSARFGLIPESTTPIVIPRPVVPAFQADSAPELVAALERRYSESS